MQLISTILLTILMTIASFPARAEGYLATTPEKLPDLVFGTDQEGLAVSVTDYQLETGKAYQLTIISTGRREYALRGDDFFNFIWVRKVQVADVEIKATGFYEIEMEREGTAMLIFVPIRPGKYKLYAKGLEAKGTVASITVK